MIQRIQTVYLLLAFITMSAVLMFPIAEYAKDNSTYLFDVFSIREVISDNGDFKSIGTLPLLLLTIIIMLLTVFTIASYKKRLLQIRLCSLNMLFIISFIAGVFLYSHKAQIAIGSTGAVTSFKPTAVFPIIGLIFFYLATRAIRKDEELVRSADRIR